MELLFRYFFFQGGGVLGKQFQKMRRRLTVTGASENIDGAAKMGPSESSDQLKKHKKKNKVRRALVDDLGFYYWFRPQKQHAVHGKDLTHLLPILSILKISLANGCCTLCRYGIFRSFKEGTCTIQSKKKESRFIDYGR